MNSELRKQLEPQLTPQAIIDYEQKGEELYTDDFMSIVTSEDPTAEGGLLNAAAYLREALKSGMNPDLLDENEVQVMESIFGQQWKKEWEN